MCEIKGKQVRKYGRDIRVDFYIKKLNINYRAESNSQRTI